MGASIIFSDCLVLTLMHTERPKLHRVLAFLSAKGLSYGEGTAKLAILYIDRFVFVPILKSIKTCNIFFCRRMKPKVPL